MPVPNTSYIATRSGPTTPGILSRSPSRHRHSHSSRNVTGNSKSYTHLAFADTVEAGLRRTSKSSTGLLNTSGNNLRHKTASKPRGKTTRRKADNDSEWLHRAGTAIATEARESKGQSWLASRASSTSLLARGTGSDEDEDDEGEDRVGATYQKLSPSASRLHSVRGSRRGSKVDHAAEGLTSSTAASSRHGSRSSLALDEIGGYFGNRRSGKDTPVGPDFVDGFHDEDSGDEDTAEQGIIAEQADEEVVARLAKEKGFGVGGLVDKLVGLSMFSESGAESDDADEVQSKGMQENRSERPTTMHYPRENVKSQAISPSGEEPSDSSLLKAGSGSSNEVPKGEEATAWTDAAWLLSVASKVLF